MGSNNITKNKRKKFNNKWKFKITMIEEPGYKKNISLKRFYSHYVWGKNIKRYLKKKKRPDVVYCAVPSLTAAYNAAQLCGKNKTNFIIDIQDIWPEAFQMFFNVPGLKNIVFFPLSIIAKRIYEKADVIIGVSQTYVDMAKRKNRKGAIVLSVYIGTELETFDANVVANLSRKNNDEIWIGYCGTLGTSYDIPKVIDALSMLNNSNIRFVIMGNGAKESEFRAYADKKGVNVTFMGRISYEKMCGILANCDMVVNPIVQSSVATIINKHADYAACGKPVINTQECEEYKKLVEYYHMGINCTSARGIARAIQKLIESPKTREDMGQNARRCAKEMFDRKETYQSIMEIIDCLEIV